MSTVPERPQGANAADPWKPSDPTRWAHLNLEDPDPSGGMPKKARVIDVLAWALVVPGAEDPVEGIVDGVRIEIAAVAKVLSVSERHLADLLTMWGRRLEAAMQLLRWIDNRERMPWEDDLDEPPPAAPIDDEPPPSAPAEAPEDLGETRNVAPSSDRPKP